MSLVSETRSFTWCHRPTRILLPFRLDKFGNSPVLGASVYTKENLQRAKTENWRLLQFFNRPFSAPPSAIPPSCPSTESDAAITYARYFQYIYDHTGKFFHQDDGQKQTVWKNLENAGGIEFVISYPRRIQKLQEVLRQAVAKACFAGRPEPERWVHLVSEEDAVEWFVRNQKLDNLRVRSSRSLCRSRISG
jgi:hypothetical protein